MSHQLVLLQQPPLPHRQRGLDITHPVRVGHLLARGNVPAVVTKYFLFVYKYFHLTATRMTAPPALILTVLAAQLWLRSGSTG